MRLTTRLMISLSTIVVIVAAVSGIFTYKSEERQLVKLVVLGADQLSKGIASATWHAMLADRRDDVYQIMDTVAAKQGIERIRMFNRHGQVTFSTKPEDLAGSDDLRHPSCSACHRAPNVRLQPTLENRVRFYETGRSQRGLAIVTPIYNEPSCSQAACHAHPEKDKVLGVLEVGMNLEMVDSELANVELRVAARVVIEILCICLFVYIFSAHFVRKPIQSLIEGTHAISQMDLDKPIELHGQHGEISSLAYSFDLMRQRLREALGEINQFTQKLEDKVAERTKELHIAHEKLLQSDRLASLGQLSASVAHEINNPVAGVLNLAMLMQRILQNDGVPPERLADFRRYLGQVVAETSRVGRIVSDLLAFSRRSNAHRTQNDLNDIVETTLSLVAHKLKLNSVMVEKRLAPDLPSVYCDRSQIQQVILNLVLNAAEAMAAHPPGLLQVETAATEGGVRLAICDNGEGISGENIRKVFDPFFTTKPEGKGVGLGLAVSYGIIQSHGGDISVQSTPGLGTIFTVDLPLKAPVTPPPRDREWVA